MEPKIYPLFLDEEEYILSIRFDEIYIYFKLVNPKNPLLVYSSRFSYEEMIEKLEILKSLYKTNAEIFLYYEKYLKKKSITLVQPLKNQQIILRLAKVMDEKETTCDLELEQESLSNEDKIDILFTLLSNIQNKIKSQKEKIEKKFYNDINILKEEHKKEIESIKQEFSEKIKKETENIKKEISNEKSAEKLIENKVLIEKKNSKSNTPFCLYNYNKDSFLATYDFNDNKNNLIDIYSIKSKSNEKYKSLEGHIDQIKSIRHFQNDVNKKNYLISSDKSQNVIIWDIMDNYKKIQKIDCKEYKGAIKSTLLLFNVNFSNNNYIVTSTNKNDYANVYSFETGELIRQLVETNQYEANYLLSWIYNEEYYIIELCNKAIIINHLTHGSKYATLKNEPEGSYFRGFIYSKNFLCCSSLNGYIKVWNLVEQKLSKVIEIKKAKLGGIIHWYNDIIIATNTSDKSLEVISLDRRKIIIKRETKHDTDLFLIEKLNNESYGNILVSSSGDKTILWTCS